jgi:hypothetical protein
MKTHIEVLDQFYATIDRNDMRAIAEDFELEIVRVEPEGFGRSCAGVMPQSREGSGRAIDHVGLLGAAKVPIAKEAT